MSAELPIANLKVELFKVLAHPIRVRAMERLVVNEASVGDLAEFLQLDVTQLSQQLAVLRRASVVTTRRAGNTIYYSVSDARMANLFAVAKDILMTQLRDSRTILDSLEGEGSGVTNAASRS